LLEHTLLEPAISNPALTPGIRVLLEPEVANAAELCQRVQINTGSRRIAADRDDDARYAGGIFVPADNWARPTAQELALLAANGTAGTDPPSRTIRLFPIPQYLYRLAWDVGIDAILSQPPPGPQAADPLLAAFCAEAARLMRIVYAPATSLTLQLRNPELASTTYDTDAGTAIGLHVDNFDRHAIDRRHQSRSRVVVNLGTEPRSLVFINLDVMQLVDACNLARSVEVFERYRWAYPLAQLFMATHPDYPVVRLQLHPGEGYLASTQNFIHDGYTVGMAAPDLTLHAVPQADPERG